MLASLISCPGIFGQRVNYVGGYFQKQENVRYGQDGGWERNYKPVAVIRENSNGDVLETLFNYTLSVKYQKMEGSQPPLLSFSVVGADGHTAPILAIFFFNGSTRFTLEKEKNEEGQLISELFLVNGEEGFSAFVDESWNDLGYFYIVEGELYNGTIKRQFKIVLSEEDSKDLYTAVWQVLNQ